MHRLAKDLLKRVVCAQDGEIGQVVDLFFDDHKWTVRYVVVATGSWFTRHRVLLSPLSVRHVDSETVAVDLTRKQVQESPDVMTNLPVSRQEEAHLMDYYGHLPYWTGLGVWGPGAPAAALVNVEPKAEDAADPGAPPVIETRRPSRGDPHLRSIREVTGYRVTGSGEELGHVDDFVIDDASFEVEFLVLATGKWRRGKQILIMARDVDSVDWPGHQVIVKVTPEALRHSPEYQPPPRSHDHHH